MAKKVVATLQKKGSKGLVKFIKSARSEKTGAYMFKAEMLPSETAKELVNKRA